MTFKNGAGGGGENTKSYWIRPGIKKVTILRFRNKGSLMNFSPNKGPLGLAIYKPLYVRI